MGPRFAVSEFPNDNPELHDGLVWAAPAPCAPALPTLRLREGGPVRVLKPGWDPATPLPPSVAPAAAAAAPGVLAAAAKPLELDSEPAVELAPELELEPVVESAPEPELEAAPVAESAPEPSGFASFVAALSGVLAQRGATRAAANIGALLGMARLAPDAFDAPTQKALVARGVLDAKTGRPTPEFSVIARAWRDVLDEHGGDLAACGGATLDVYGAELCATLLDVPSGRADELRRALRQRGVAAFGMLVAA
ncbi:MAG TPA: hypothetical protein VFZ53_17895 [Polyangiaceae bacterium]